jgi:hypothetical protein
VATEYSEEGLIYMIADFAVQLVNSNMWAIVGILVNDETLPLSASAEVGNVIHYPFQQLCFGLSVLVVRYVILLFSFLP